MDFHLRFDKSRAQAQEMKEGRSEFYDCLRGPCRSREAWISQELPTIRAAKDIPK
jgi:hypothetical protein